MKKLIEKIILFFSGKSEEKHSDLIPRGVLHSIVPVEHTGQWDDHLFENKIYLQENGNTNSNKGRKRTKVIKNK